MDRTSISKYGSSRLKVFQKVITVKISDNNKDFSKSFAKSLKNTCVGVYFQ